MIVRVVTALVITTLLNACATDGISLSSPSVCQGFGCGNRPGEQADQAATHKPTKDEKIRAHRGENPDFGSDDIRISGPGISF
ncbi:hypothetical protein PJX95_16255 [Serratia rubidaea]|uniref:hypothetical protein n=1 Tax=Serratia rubidaea TaxID=61652 RepID=UPI000F81D70A|nr:hypothetical protein [Serratia rubidaea]MDC6119607.1 hypothetical protein [Serratia rubidaea]